MRAPFLSLLVLAAAGMSLPSVPAAAPVAVVSVTDANDVAFDRYNTLYVSATGRLVRYDMRRGELLPELTMGGTLLGLDVDAADCHLAVADATVASTGTIGVWMVEQGSGVRHNVLFSRDDGEGGTYDVAFIDNNSLYVTTTYLGSGWVPMRRLSLPHMDTEIVRGVRQDTMIETSADGRFYAYSEGNISSGPVVLGDTRTDEVLSVFNTNWFMFEIGISPDGSVLAAPSYYGMFVVDNVDSQLLDRGDVIGAYAHWGPLSVAFAKSVRRRPIHLARSVRVAQAAPTRQQRAACPGHPVRMPVQQWHHSRRAERIGGTTSGIDATWLKRA